MPKFKYFIFSYIFFLKSFSVTYDPDGHRMGSFFFQLFKGGYARCNIVSTAYVFCRSQCIKQEQEQQQQQQQRQQQQQIASN